MSIKSDWNELKKNGFKGLLGNTANKLNPLAAAPRAGALQLVQMNGLGLALRIYPALLSGSELSSGGFDVANAEKARKAWESIKKKWIQLGGSPSSLEKAVRKGYNKKPFKLKSNKMGQAMVATGGTSMALIQAGTPIIIGFVAILQNLGVKKNPYAAKQLDTSDMDVNTDEIANAAEILDEVKSASDQDKEAGLTEDSGTPKAVYIIGGAIVLTGLGLLIYKAVKK